MKFQSHIWEHRKLDANNEGNIVSKTFVSMPFENGFVFCQVCFAVEKKL